MERRRLGILFIVFGLLDLFVFYRNFGFMIRTFESFETLLIPFGIPAVNVLLTLSLIATGVLSIIANRWALIIYYFQFPLRLAFLKALTFGFLFRLFPTHVGTFAHGMMMATVFAFEAMRLMLTLQQHKRM